MLLTGSPNRVSARRNRARIVPTSVPIFDANLVPTESAERFPFGILGLAVSSLRRVRLSPHCCAVLWVLADVPVSLVIFPIIILLTNYGVKIT